MIGIDISRIKRWYKSTYPQYSGVDYRIEVTSVSVQSFDFRGGMDALCTVRAYKESDNTIVDTKYGIYHRMDYGGWSCEINPNT